MVSDRKEPRDGFHSERGTHEAPSDRRAKQFVPDGPDLGERKEKRLRSGTANRVNSFTDTLPWLGPLLFVLSTLYFLAQVAVAWVWVPPYSFANNTISDLGNTACHGATYSNVCCSCRVMTDTAFVSGAGDGSRILVHLSRVQLCRQEGFKA